MHMYVDCSLQLIFTGLILIFTESSVCLVILMDLVSSSLAQFRVHTI
jgi:hypothetical protein